MTENKRPDRAKKLQDKKGKSETVIKACLRKLLLFDEQKKATVCRLIEKRVVECSKRTHNASLALNLLVREWFHNKEVKNVVVPEFWDTTFVRQLMLGVQGTHKPFPEISELSTRHPNLFPLLERSNGDRNIYSHSASKLATNIKNHLRLNLPKVIKRYICSEVQDKDVQVDTIYQVFGWKRKEKQLTANVSVSNTIREILDLDEGEEISTSWLKENQNLLAMLRLFVHANRRFEETGHKLFNILPICKIKPHFITIDTSSMVPLLKELDVIKTNNPKEVDSKSLWESFINISKIKTSRLTFTGTIDTDGVAINVHFQRPKAVSTKDDKLDLTGKRLMAVDPGRVNIFTIVEKMADNSFKEYVLRRGHYYKASGMTKAKKKTESWHKPIQEELTALSLKSPKSLQLINFHEYLVTVKNVEERLWEQYFQRKWRDQRLRLYGGKKRTFTKFFNSLGFDQNTIVAFGSAKFAPTGKGELSVPTTRAYKELSYRVKTFLVDEFRTSKIYWKDDSILQNVARPKESNGYETVRGLLWCCSTKSNMFVNRDTNAAINIWRCGMMYPQRPTSLTRIRGQERINQTRGRIIPR